MGEVHLRAAAQHDPLNRHRNTNRVRIFAHAIVAAEMIAAESDIG